MLELCAAKASENGGSKKKKLNTGLWDVKIPTELLQRILSCVELKANIQASAVCKTWCESAVSVRKLKRRPWLFYPVEEPFKLPNIETYVLTDPTSWIRTYNLSFPDLKGHRFACSRDGWLLVIVDDPSKLIFFLNPFTGARISLPDVPGNCFVSSDSTTSPSCFAFSDSTTSPSCFAFSAAPTSTRCLVISLVQLDRYSIPVIMTWRPGQTVWTTYCFENPIPYRTWDKCVFSDGMFYCLSTCGYLGVFDPSKPTWNMLPVEPCTAFSYPPYGRRVLLMDHEGDIFLMSARYSCDPTMFKLNLEHNVWEEKRELGGLTVFASHPSSLTIAGLPAEDRNRMYPSQDGQHGLYYSFGGKTSSLFRPTNNYLSDVVAWVDPPNDFNLYMSF